MPNRNADTITTYNQVVLRRAITVQTAADMMDVTTKTIRKYIAEGKLPAYRFGPRAIRVYVDDVVALLSPVGGDGDLDGAA